MLTETLYKRDSKGKIRVWSITALSDALEIEHGCLGGSMQVKYEDVPYGKAARSQEEQVESRFWSRINKQLDSGYVSSLEQAERVGPTNTLGLCQPMLAQDYKDVPFNQPVFMQRKYDGNRCIIHNHPATGLMAYSRGGKLIHTIDHILDGLDLPVGASIDGELYCHGYKLQQIVSWIKRKQENSLKLKYHAYDFVSKDPFEARFKKLSDVKGNIEIVETWAVPNKDALYEYHKRFREEGYEGSIIRLNGSMYEDGRRSKHLLRMKDWQDAEYQVVDITPSKDHWAVLTCVMPSGKTFKVTAPGTMYEKEEVLLNKQNYIGKRVTVEYAYFTEDGIPFHPVAKCWR